MVPAHLQCVTLLPDRQPASNVTGSLKMSHCGGGTGSGRSPRLHCAAVQSSVGKQPFQTGLNETRT